MYTLDLQLTTLEFRGLLSVLRHIAREADTVPVWELSEDELLLLRYAKTMTPSRLAAWAKREKREKRSLERQPRYHYKADWLLVKVLYWLLGDVELGYECSALRGQLQQILLNPRAHDTGSTGGIVDTLHIIVP